MKMTKEVDIENRALARMLGTNKKKNSKKDAGEEDEEFSSESDDGIEMNSEDDNANGNCGNHYIYN